MESACLETLGLIPLVQDGRWPCAFINQQLHYAADNVCDHRSPINGSSLCGYSSASPQLVADAVTKAEQAFKEWRIIPAPRRGELVRAIAVQVQQHKTALAELITLESGKILSESLGEVQEWLDICDFAVGLSRQLYGLTMASERPWHRLQEQWHPLGPIGIITAFNFPVAVWAWNAMLALVCGDSTIWKPSEKTPLSALACCLLVQRAMADFPDIPVGLVQMVQGQQTIGELLVADRRLPLLSATGSVRMGKAIAPQVAARLGRCLLELGGNNAAIITPSANLELALRASVFAAAGTCGQRCTSLRRLFIHVDVYDSVVARLQAIYAGLRVGDPRLSDVLVGPLIDAHAFAQMQQALAAAQAQGGQVLVGGERVMTDVPANGFYVRPAIVAMAQQTAIVHDETFAPILYVLPYADFDAVIAMHNAVSQGLSSALFTQNLLEAERFLSAQGSDCGIANINAGTSGAEIGGAFGGEKDSGGGRESGSDAWKNYMRRVTNTINYGNTLPLAQGVKFDI